MIRTHTSRGAQGCHTQHAHLHHVADHDLDAEQLAQHQAHVELARVLLAAAQLLGDVGAAVVEAVVVAVAPCAPPRSQSPAEPRTQAPSLPAGAAVSQLQVPKTVKTKLPSVAL